MVKVKPKKEKQDVCSICQLFYIGFGNNAQPINKGRCCDKCNVDFVIPIRMLRVFKSRKN